NKFIKIIKDKSIIPFIRGKTAETLGFFGINNNNNIINLLIEVIKDKNIDFEIRKDVAKSIDYLSRDYNKFINALIDVIKNKNINLEDRERVATILSLLDKNKKVINILTKVIKNAGFGLRTRGYIANSLAYYGKKDDEFIYTIIDIAERTNAWVRWMEAKTITHIDRNDDKFIDIIIEVINRYSFDTFSRKILIKFIVSLEKNNDEIINKIMRYKHSSKLVKEEITQDIQELKNQGRI
ncbi:MAG: hypothetical protein K0U38_05110, partial [Epsilonproteobacteria bacterium]|nr:hypothetical protein [Campylobacterota bacterium]